MKILVCGGRDFDNKNLLTKTLYDLCDEYNLWSEESYCENKVIVNLTIINGAAPGADSLATDFAVANRLQLREFPANWNEYGKRAGFIRNKQMLIEGKPDLVVAFPGGKGTAMMLKIAKEAGVLIRTIKP